MTKLILLGLLLSIISACGKINHTDDLKFILGKSIVFPQISNDINDAKWIVYNRDTIITIRPNTPKIIVYYNKNGCQSCRLKELYNWKSLIDDFDLKNSNNRPIDFIFIFNSGSDTHTLGVTLQHYLFDIPVLCDRSNQFEQLNILPKSETLHCFLVDHNNRIVLAGSPLKNTKIRQLYESKIDELIIMDNNKNKNK